MRTLLLLACLVAAGSTAWSQTAPAAPAAVQPETAPKPSPAPAPARRPAQPAVTRGGFALTVTSPQGLPLEGVRVEIVGASDRSAETNASGQVNFASIQAGTYRLRFSGEQVVTFEREAAVRAGQVASLDVTLYPAPPPREIRVPVPAEPAPAPPPPVGPIGEPRTAAIPDVLEREFVGRQARRDTLLSCSGTTRTTMIQLNEPLPERVYEHADTVYYVLGGEGTLRLAGRESRLATNGFASIPRGTPHAFERRGSRPLVLLAVVGGEPCEDPR